jgi:hypothetical protein
LNLRCGSKPMGETPMPLFRSVFRQCPWGVDVPCGIDGEAVFERPADGTARTKKAPAYAGA